MKNLIKAIEAEQKNRLNDFILTINQVVDLKGLDTWQYRDLLPKGKKVDLMTFDSLKAYLIDRKQKAIYKAIEREVNHVKTVFNAGTLVEVKITMEWKRSQMWGANPTAEAWYRYKDADGNLCSNYVKSGSIGGCGYDKGSTAVAECLNQINEVLKPLFAKKDKAMKIDKRDNRDLLGYVQDMVFCHVLRAVLVYLVILPYLRLLVINLPLLQAVKCLMLTQLQNYK